MRFRSGMQAWFRPRHFISALAACAACLTALPLLAADMGKTLRVLIVSGETSFDPAVASDLNTLSINENLFDPLLRYDYLARPVKLRANTARDLPETESDGKTYTFHLQRGIRFAASPAFQGKSRELTAHDYVYSIKRLYDPKLKSPWLFLFDGLIAGDEALKREPFDIDRPIDGLQALDRHTLRIRLTRPDNNFLFKMAMPATAAVAREAIEAYGADAGNHPVGTGPYLIAEWQRSSRIVLRANPDFRATIFDHAPPAHAEDRDIASSLRGRRLPLIGRIDIRVVDEPQPRLLGFLQREFDILEQVPPALIDKVMANGKLKPELAARRVRLALSAPLQTYYLWMNMDDPVLGGYGKDRIALRRAIALSYDRDEDIRLLEHGLALPAHSPLPPDVLGHDPGYRSPVRRDTELANALLDRFSYARGRDGYRNTPEGKPLILTMHTLASSAGRLRDEFWRRNLDAIGVRVEFKSDKHGEIIKAARLGKVQMYETNWIADFPDGENFFQLLYGPNSGRVNYARFRQPAFDRLYEEAGRLRDSPQRTRLYDAMTQSLHMYAPWVLRIHPLSADLHQPWVRHYKRHPVELTNWRYLDIDDASRSPQ